MPLINNSLNDITSIPYKETTVPTSPPAGKQQLYIDSADHLLKRVNSAGTVKVIEGGDMTNPMTTAGDVIYGGAAGAPTRLAVGTAGQHLVVNAGATAPAWVTPPGARVYNNADISINNASLTALTFNAERYDTDAIHDTGTNTGRLTCKTAGVYDIKANIAFASNSTGYRAVYVKINGTTYIEIENKTAINGTTTYVTASTIYQLAVNDYVEIEVYQTSGGALNITSAGNLSPEFMMQRIG